MKGFYIHIKTKNLYNVLGISRCMNNTNKKYVIYEQLFFKKKMNMFMISVAFGIAK